MPPHTNSGSLPALADPVRRRFLIGLGGAAIALLVPGTAMAGWRSARHRRRMQRLVLEQLGFLRNRLARRGKRFLVSPDLALAVCERESGFDPNAQGPIDEIGLFQIRPGLARKDYGVDSNALRNPVTNSRIGIHYLNRLLAMEQGIERFALSWYNGGSGTGVYPDARVLRATRNYVDDILYVRKPRFRRMLRDGLV